MNTDAPRINRSPTSTALHENDYLLQRYLNELHQNHQDSATRDLQPSSKKPHSKVSFSEKSVMHIYASDPSYDLSKSYEPAERKSFGQRAVSDAVQIKRLASTTPGATTKDAFKYLLQNGHLSTMDILGIEHLVFPHSMSQFVRVRRQHALAVLREQERQRGRASPEDATERLGSLSASGSFGAARKARARAAMAA